MLNKQSNINLIQFLIGVYCSLIQYPLDHKGHDLPPQKTDLIRCMLCLRGTNIQNADHLFGNVWNEDTDQPSPENDSEVCIVFWMTIYWVHFVICFFFGS